MVFEQVGQFASGVMDALRIPDALLTISLDKELRWLNLKCFVLNGLLYLGTVIIYAAFTAMLFYRSAAPAPSSSDQNE